jgi:hypothetical protein
MILAVASGKGGTGKTALSVSLARVLGSDARLLDCDVEEPDDHLAFLWPAIRMSYEGLGKGARRKQEGNSIPEHKSGFSIFGFVIGMLTGIVGLGGGYALVPGLIYLFGAPVYITMGTSLATMIPLAVVGGAIKMAQGHVAIGAGLLLAIGTVVGAQVGTAMIKKFKSNTLKLVFGLYFLYVSAKFITGYFGIMIW